jgi:hypothetical protein
MPFIFILIGVLLIFALIYFILNRRNLRETFLAKGHEILNSDECSADVASIVENITNIIDIDNRNINDKIGLLQKEFSDPGLAHGLLAKCGMIP